MRWVPCHEAASEVDGRIVAALLEGEGIPARTQPMGTSVFPIAPFGVRVLVSDGDLDRARAVLARQDAPDEKAAAGSWHCAHCDTVVDDDLAACWSCGRPRPDMTAVPVDTVGSRPTEPRLPIVATVAAALRLVVTHPFLLVAAVPPLVWAVVATTLGIPGQGFFASDRTADGLAAFVWACPLAVFFGPLGQGLAIAIAAGAVRGASFSQSLGVVARKLPALVILSVPWLAVAGPSLVAIQAGRLFGSGAVRSVVAMLGLLPSVYLSVRLVFSAVAIVVDEVGVVEGLTRSWALTQSLWWRTAGLITVTGMVRLPGSILPAPFDVVVDCAVQVVLDTSLCLAYLRLTGRQAAEPARHPPAIPAPAV